MSNIEIIEIVEKDNAGINFFYLIPKKADLDLIFGDPWGRGSGLTENGFVRRYKGDLYESWTKKVGEMSEKLIQLSYTADSRDFVRVIPFGEPESVYITRTGFRIYFQGIEDEKEMAKVFTEELGGLFDLAHKIK